MRLVQLLPASTALHGMHGTIQQATHSSTINRAQKLACPCICSHISNPAAAAAAAQGAHSAALTWRTKDLHRSMQARQQICRTGRGSSVSAAALLQQPLSVLLPHKALTAATAAAKHGCNGLPPVHARGCSTASSSRWQQHVGSAACRSSLNLNPGPLYSIHPSFSCLCAVQQWPSQTAHSRSNGKSSNGNGNGNGTMRSSPSSRTQEEFASLDSAELAAMGFDAIVVLAGGLLPDGSLPEWAERRMEVGRDLHMLLGRKPPILCSGGGTPHKPAVLGPTGHVLHESTSMASYLIARGVEPAAILKETASYDTVGNTYMSLAVHVLPAGWRNIAVVTSDFHMPRSRALFADVYRMAGDSIFGDPHRFTLTFLAASDQGVFDDYVYHARLDKESGSLLHWQGVAATLHSLADMHAWLHEEHLCYAVQRQHEFGKRTIKDQKLLESY